MRRVPHARAVGKTLRAVRVAAQKALKGVNEMAGQQMAKGDYATAESLISKAKEIRLFQSDIDTVFQKWREVCATKKQKDTRGKQATTPLWQYYQPILRGLAQLDGECRRPELEERVLEIMADSFLPGDNLPMASGRERWRKMIQRARKHLVVEGWIEKNSGPIWKITEGGRRAAEKAGSKGPAN